MKTILLTGLAAITSTALAFSPAPADAQVQSGVLIIYGNDKCPTNSDGQEVVVCRRLGESERYRIPKDLRDTSPSPDKQSWAVRQRSALDAYDSGIGSCSTIGAGGQTGCFEKAAAEARKARKARKEAEKVIP